MRLLSVRDQKGLTTEAAAYLKQQRKFSSTWEEMLSAFFAEVIMKRLCGERDNI